LRPMFDWNLTLLYDRGTYTNTYAATVCFDCEAGNRNCTPRPCLTLFSYSTLDSCKFLICMIEYSIFALGRYSDSQHVSICDNWYVSSLIGMGQRAAIGVGVGVGVRDRARALGIEQQW
jgi:hypothetical protein